MFTYIESLNTSSYIQNILLVILIISIFYLARAITNTRHYQYGRKKNLVPLTKEERLRTYLELVKDQTKIIEESEAAIKRYNERISGFHIEYFPANPEDPPQF